MEYITTDRLFKNPRVIKTASITRASEMDKYTGKFFKGYEPQFYFRTKVQRNEINPLADIKITVN